MFKLLFISLMYIRDSTKVYNFDDNILVDVSRSKLLCTGMIRTDSNTVQNLEKIIINVIITINVIIIVIIIITIIIFLLL